MVVSVAIVLPVASASGSRATHPPAAMFKKGYNLCKTASLAAIKKAGGQAYKVGVFDGHVCNWERKDLKAGITLSTITGSEAVGTKAQMGTIHGSKIIHGVKIKSVAVKGASIAMLEALPPVVKGEVHKDLFAAYGPGIVHVSMTAPGSLPDSRLFGVLKAVTKT